MTKYILHVKTVTCYILKMVQPRYIVSVEGEFGVVHALSIGDINDDLERP